MDEQRIERALRLGPPDEPTYEPSGRGARQPAGLQDARDHGAGSSDVAFAGGVVRGPVVTPRARPGGFLTAAALAAAFVLVAVAISVRPDVDTGATPSGGTDALGRIQDTGTIRIAVTTGFPQTTAGGGSVIGFDVDVAQAVAKSLGVRDDVVGLAPADIHSASGTWDLALPSSGMPVAGLTAGPVYYAWPSWLVVTVDSSATAPDDIAGQSICVVTGSAGVAWFQGLLPTDVEPALSPPIGATILERETDSECFDTLEQGEAAGAVTATVFNDELASRGIRSLGDDAVFVEPRRIFMRGSGPEVGGLLSAIETAISELDRSGRLAELSRRAFGGRDLTGGVR